jgi:hypothetical protein
LLAKDWPRFLESESIFPSLVVQQQLRAEIAVDDKLRMSSKKGYSADPVHVVRIEDAIKQLVDLLVHDAVVPIFAHKVKQTLRQALANHLTAQFVVLQLRQQQQTIHKQQSVLSHALIHVRDLRPICRALQIS